jgi:hypothetical protein
MLKRITCTSGDYHFTATVNGAESVTVTDMDGRFCAEYATLSDALSYIGERFAMMG